MECCALCLNPFLTQNAIKHRKLIYGSSFTNEVTFLNTLISSSWPGSSLRTRRLLCAEKAFICMTCQKDVIKCKKLHEEYVQLSSSILSKIQALVTPQAAAQPIQNPHVYNRKRSYQQAFNTLSGCTQLEATTELLSAASPEVSLSSQPPISTVIQPLSTVTQPPSTVTQPPSTVTQPLSSVTQPPSTVTQPPSTVTQPLSSVTQPPSIL